MSKLLFAALLAIGPVAVQAQPSASMMPIQPSVDSVQQRQALRNLAVCLVHLRPRWARSTLAHPYLSDAQSQAAWEAVRGRDNCMPGHDDAEVTFRTTSMVSSLAEYFLRADIGRVDFERLSNALPTIAPRNASEDFGLCVASRNPAAARDLALSELGSAAEEAAASHLAGDLAPCIVQGQQLSVDLQSLRALTSAALYRGVTTVLASGN